MANRRMLSKSISVSKQVNSMSEFAQLLFTWMITHADDWGCMDGDPDVVMATVIPMKRDRKSQDVAKALKEMVDAQLIWWYEVDGQQIIQFRKWEEHQTGLHKRSKPKFPLYNDIPGTSGNFPEVPKNSALTEQNRTEQNGTEQNGTEGKGKERKTPSKIQYADYVSMTEEEYQKLVTQYGEDFTKRCIEVLDNYKGANGKRYKDDYRAILNWVVRRVVEEKGPPKPPKPQEDKYKDVYFS